MKPNGISVLIATRNRAEILRRTLEDFCVLLDPGIPWELLIVDNGSSDSTPLVVESFEDRLPIRYLYEGTPGKVNALNAGIPQAQCDLLVMTDDDITPCKGWLRVYLTAAIVHPDASYFGGPIELDLSSCEIPHWALNNQGELDRWLSGQLAQFGPADSPPEQWCFNGGNVAYRTALFEQYGAFDPRLGHAEKSRLAAEETLFQIRLSRAGEKPHYVRDALVWHRIHQGELTFQSRFRRIWWASRGKAMMLYIANEDTRVNLLRTLRHVRYSFRILPNLFARSTLQFLKTLCELIGIWGYEMQMIRLLWQ